MSDRVAEAPQPLRLVVIDDNVDDRVLVIRQLERDIVGAQVIAVAGPDELGSVLESESFDAVITDYQLRWSDGLSVLHGVRARYPEHPVIMFTNTGTEEVAVEAMKAGLDDYIIKSRRSFVRLPAAVIAALDRRQARLRMAAAEAELAALNAALELRVRERTAQLEAANDELELFAAMAAHDLREPLRAVQAFAAAVLEDEAAQIRERSRIYLERMLAVTAEMDTLVGDLLEYSRLGRAAVQLQPVRVAAALAAVLTRLGPDLAARGAEVQVGDVELDVVGEWRALSQVLGNLIANAVTYVPPEQKSVVRVWATTRGATARIWVADNGIGIAPEHQARVFEVFTRLHGDESYPGTGVGLAIVRRGAERMGGRAGVESTSGQGSRFWVELPLADE